MVISNEFLINYRQIIKLYENILKEIQIKYELSKLEVDIISFLHNNPSLNTARDIVEFRLLQKGNVSQALELLSEKGLVIRKSESLDKRITSLFLAGNSINVTKDIDILNKKFQKVIFENFTNKDIELYSLFNKKILNNINKGNK